MADSPPILEFSHVTVEADQNYDSSIWDVHFSLRPGDLALVRLEMAQRNLPLADAAQGLVEPAAGIIRFMGEDWSTATPARAAELRGHTGRVFDGRGWASNLDVDENIFLGQRYHTRRSPVELADEAAALARMFGLPGLPRGRPNEVRPPDLQRAACVRAFLGHPKLLILETPTTAAVPGLLPAMINAIRAARARGAGVLWTTIESTIWNDSGIRPTYKCLMTGSQMVVNETAHGEP